MKAEYINVCKGYTENITEEVFSEIQSLIELYKNLAQIQTSEEVKEEAGDDDVVDEDEVDEDVVDEDEGDEHVADEDEGDEDTCQSNTMSVELYERFKDTCYMNSDKHLCNEVEKFRVMHNEIIKRAKNCAQYQILQPFQKHSERSSFTIPFISLSAVSFVSFITYKFTPFGSWIRNRIPGGNNLMHKIDKENREAQYTSERQDTPYRVGYHSSR
ncbi:hypothetical protein PVBG_03314 [Plasmodium vivax Brazil I]|uniref:Uncharacterized protein n=1 Tax=Plasmodium vivax (strain Brazil I) TaxID=1033975 RepID=A0A0J9VQH3_PLAV1|nr:hypothetical protein PVBG_03314 [Plasmodium vivax Brazil I]